MKNSIDATAEFSKVNGAPFNGHSNRGGMARRQGSIEENRFNNDYYNSGGVVKHDINSSSSSTRENGQDKKAYGSRVGNPESHASQMNMKRNESDFQIQ